MEVPPETLKEVYGRRKATKAVFAHGSPQELPDADRFVPLRGGCRRAVRNRLKDALKPRRVNLAKDLAPEHQIAERANGVRGAGAVDDLPKQDAVRCQR